MSNKLIIFKEKIIMERIFVYELVNLMGTVEYVGVSKNPNRRFEEHTKQRPYQTSQNGEFKANYGKFYRRSDIILNVVTSFDNTTDAHKLEDELKMEYSLERTEYNRRAAAGKKSFAFAAKAAGSKIFECPECGRSIKSIGGLNSHRRTHKNKVA